MFHRTQPNEEIDEIKSFQDLAKWHVVEMQKFTDGEARFRPVELGLLCEKYGFTSGPFLCLKCPKSFQTVREWVFHAKWCGTKSLMQCYVCDVKRFVIMAL